MPLPTEETRLYHDKFIFSRGEEGFIAKRNWKWVALAALVTLACLWLWTELRDRRFEWQLFVSTLAGLRLQWLLLACVFSSATYLGRALRWAVLLRPLNARPGIWNLFTATAIGFTAITLLGRPGEFVRPYLISVKARVPFSSQLAAWLLERIYDLLMALAVFGFALSRVRHSGVKVGPALSWVLAGGGWIVGSLAVLCLLVLLVIRQFSGKMRVRLLEALSFLHQHHYARAERLVNAFVQGVEATRSHYAVALLTLYTILEWLLIAVCNVCVINAFGSVLHFDLLDVLIFMGFVSFGAVVQIPGIGGGSQVVSVVVLTELFSVPLEVATALATLLWIITFVVIVPPGLLLAVHEGLNWKKLKALRREVEV